MTANRERGASEALKSAGASVGDLEERVELRQLEQRFQVVVEIGEPELPALFPDLLGQRNQHAQAGTVDVAGLREVDQELASATFELVEDFLFQLLPIADDELPFDIDHDRSEEHTSELQ